MTNFYIYYRIDESKLASLRTSIARLLDAVERETGVRGRWMRRRDDPSTFMEVYEGIGDDKAFEALLLREAAGLGLERRVERFICA